MSQIINFYQEEFKKPSIVFPLKQMVYVLLIMSALCFLYVSYLFIYINGLQTQLHENVRLNEKVSLKITELEKSLELPKPDAALESVLKNKLEINSDKKRLINYISKMSVDKNFTSSAYYDALQNNDEEGIWLTEIVLSDNSKNISLKGVGKNASALPVYIENLKNYSVFKTKSYYSMVMVKQDTEPHYVDFYFTSLKKENEKGI